MLWQNLDEIHGLPYWVADTETTGLDPYLNKVILLQIGNRHKQFLIDTREVQDLGSLREKFEDETFLKIFHHAKFDYKMIKGTFGINMEGLRCTMLGEQIIRAGVMKRGFSMEACCLRYLGINIDKEMQTSFIGHVGEFSRKQLDYAALDCVYPDCYAERQDRILIDQKLKGTYIIECNAIPAFADAEYYGMLLDEEKWGQNIIEEEGLKEDAEKRFYEAAAPHVAQDLFGAPAVNIASSVQILDLFSDIFGREHLKDTNTKDKKSPYGTGSPILKNLCESFDNPPIVKALLDYREHDKKVSTYGYSYLSHIHPMTGRFHPKIDQVGTETGRPSGKKPNMLNIPASPRYRHPWIAGPGRKVLTNDYGACELRIMASMSGDPVMCKGFNDGVDYHTFTASQFIVDKEHWLREFHPHPKGEPGKGTWGDYILNSNGEKIQNPNFNKLVPYEQVTSGQRKVAKTINFGLAYGMGAKKLADTLKIPIPEAKEYINKFNTTFKVLVEWLKSQQEKALEQLYAETYLGRKRYFTAPRQPEWKPEWDGLVSAGCNFNDPFDELLPEEYKNYYSRKAGIKREGGNSPIQGGNADITKIAMYKLRKWIRQFEKESNNGEYLAHVALQVYDEIIVDCPEQYAELFAQKMDEIMKDAGKEVIIRVPVETGCIIDDSWVKG
jgi:DNA polymerase-1